MCAMPDVAFQVLGFPVYNNNFSPHAMSDKENLTKKILREKTALEQWREDFYNKTVQKLRTEDRFVNYFKQFEPKSVESFIQSYAKQKVQWYEVGEQIRKYEKSKQSAWLQDCFIGLKLIQQKKLFDNQCLWRAGKMKLEGIEITNDFNYWENHIFECPAISPVNQVEIDFFLLYLSETSCLEPFDDRSVFQEYDEILNSYRKLDDGWSYSSWYRFCDEVEGTNNYMELPDLMGEKEEFYLSLYRKDYQSKNKAEIEVQNQKYANQLPYLSTVGDDFLENYIKENETPAFYRLYLEDKRFRDKSERLEKPENFISILEEIPGKLIPVVPADDWAISVSATYEQYRRERIIETMPHAYQIYLNHIGEDWEYPGKENYFRNTEDRFEGLGKMIRNMIISGRILNGEPADLNYY
jgi:hypothetical protein